MGNEFLRHIMKARLRSLVVDFSTYEAGMRILIQLFDEIAVYLETIVFPETKITQMIGGDHDVLYWQVTDATT